MSDPICGMTVDPGTAAATRERQGQRFYFWSEDCRDGFAAGAQLLTGKDQMILTASAGTFSLTM
jgi:P-type Cu+ transporter